MKGGALLQGGYILRIGSGSEAGSKTNPDPYQSQDSKPVQVFDGGWVESSKYGAVADL